MNKKKSGVCSTEAFSEDCCHADLSALHFTLQSILDLTADTFASPYRSLNVTARFTSMAFVMSETCQYEQQEIIS